MTKPQSRKCLAPSLSRAATRCVLLLQVQITKFFIYNFVVSIVYNDENLMEIGFSTNFGMHC